MLNYIKEFIKSLTPKFAFRIYHLSLAHMAAIWYWYPSEKLIVVGVTGTKGKSTTANLIAQLLELSGEKVGLTSTATMKVAEREWLSDKKMTMPGRFQLQKLLNDMVNAGCKYAVIETSSEGIEQFRNRGIHYDVVALTNFTPEHIEAHGSYENYRAAKGKLFIQLKKSTIKKINGREINKRIILDPNGGEYEFFKKFNAGDEWNFSFGDGEDREGKKFTVKAEEYKDEEIFIKIRGQKVSSHLLFKFNALNVLAAITSCVAMGYDENELIQNVGKLKSVPGRQEFIDEGQNFKIMVDYTYEPTSMKALYGEMSIIKHKRIIQVLGPTGGGRDKWRRPVIGEVAALNADMVVVTTDDPYDDDPSKMADEVIVGARKIEKSGKVVDIKKIIDRRTAIKTALELARAGDLVLITGKGAEQKMALAHGAYVEWDDREVVREELKNSKFI